MPFWHIVPALLSLLSLAAFTVAETDDPVLSNERVVFQLDQGDIEFAFFPEVAPVTSAHIFQLVQLGLYESNQIFRVDKGFVAQTSDVVSGRLLALNPQQQEFASKQVPLEVKEGVKHHEGILSMARGGDPGSGSSSFFICYGTAPHLDMQYGVFGVVLHGMDVMHKLEGLPTKREGIFVMPVDRVTIHNTYWYILGKPMPGLTLPGKALAGSEGADTADVQTGSGTQQTSRRSLGATEQGATSEGEGSCATRYAELELRFTSLSLQMEKMRGEQLP